MFTINASDAGLLYLRKNTYFNMVGSPFGQIEIPTNCCDNPMGKVFFPFEVIGWTDTYGNDCDDSNHAMETDGSGEEKDMTVMDVNGAMISQYPNPADDNSTFEFSVMETQNVSVSILNIKGQIVETIYSGIVEALTTYRVDYDVSGLQSGIYFVHLNTNNNVLKKKFVILK
ncbi:MAG: T9SS type A sorting domain-containing protein [Flavobacteriales bacterium]|nr:T9SS type A sorting domain-containing protein [Flavobacteriales bacterium]